MAQSLDFSEVEQMARELGRTASSSGRVLTGLAHGAGKGMKAQMRKEAGGVQGGRVQRAIDYTVKGAATGFEVEAGPRRGGAGSLAFFYYGNSRMTNPPIADPIFTLRDEARKTERAAVTALMTFFGGVG